MPVAGSYSPVDGRTSDRRNHAQESAAAAMTTDVHTTTTATPLHTVSHENSPRCAPTLTCRCPFRQAMV